MAAMTHGKHAMTLKTAEVNKESDVGVEPLAITWLVDLTFPSIPGIAEAAEHDFNRPSFPNTIA